MKIVVQTNGSFVQRERAACEGQPHNEKAGGGIRLYFELSLWKITSFNGFR